MAVESQSEAATAILAGHDNVAGIGGFSGEESSVSLAWIQMEVRGPAGSPYILGEIDQHGGRLLSTAAPVSAKAIAAAEKTATKLTVKSDGRNLHALQAEGLTRGSVGRACVHRMITR